MHERSIFMTALEHQAPDRRSAFLDEACANDPALRQRVEELLKSHEEAGEFLGKPVAERLAEQRGIPLGAEETQGHQHANGDDGPLECLAPSDTPGSLGRLGHYEVQELIGRGGMGIVLRAFDERLHRVVAIKVMAAQLATSAAARKRFIREARTAAAISHDHIVTIHAVEEANGLPYIAMQFVAGVSLQHRLDKSGPLELREIVRIGMQTAAGLAAAHAQGLIHRDIKPANILLENGVERVKITDFGLARAVADASVTQTGMVAGTPQYMSPEQARGEMVDRRSDLFSLGSVLYAMCTGQPPFRGDSGIAVLRRVCDDTPRSIREINPEIPEWLVALINKLQAKDPAERYQAAAEVAELLNNHLAHLQHPSVVPLPAVEKPARHVPVRRRLWVIAAAVLLCIAAGLGLTEAAGVTKLTASVIRVLTPEGTLIVEVDDPGVSVTVEGDGGLVITGAGPKEVRLRPGSYKVRATKDGKSIRDEELITITRGDKRVVKVSHEAASVPAAPTTLKPAVQPFVVLTSQSVIVRKFDTLAEAVLGASDGDTIEVCGNGPFVTPALRVRDKALCIRAGEGLHPVIQLNQEGIKSGEPLLYVDGDLGALILEGLEMQRVGTTIVDDGSKSHYLLFSERAPLHVANCRLLQRVDGPGRVVRNSLWVQGCPVLQVRNCQFVDHVSSAAIKWQPLWAPQVGEKGIVKNCPFACAVAVSLPYYDPSSGSLTVENNTLATDRNVQIWLYKGPPLGTPPGKTKPLHLEARENIFGGDTNFVKSKGYSENNAPMSAQEAEDFLQHLILWKEARNLYGIVPGKPLLTLTSNGAYQKTTRPYSTLAEWQDFWRLEALDSLQALPVFQGGDLLGRARQDPEKLVPEDFRLASGSPGKGAGKDGQDLGADIDLVGPGAAYERWKSTPEYQQWLKDTGQEK